MSRRIVFAFFLSMVFSCRLLSAQANQLIQGIQYQVGASPMAAAAGDFNGDGYTDLVVTNKVDGTVSILLGDGHGSFAPQVTYNLNGIPAGVALGDFNHDGKPDLVVALPALTSGDPDSQVAVLLNNGDGAFAPAVYYSTAGSPQFVAVQDLDGDGWPDIVVTNTGSGATPGSTVSVLMNSAGTFAPHTEYATGSGPLWVTIADLNKDGIPDLAVANSLDGTISVLRGYGNGTFGPQVTYAVGSFPAAIASADFDNDGAFDLAVGNFNDQNISILLGNGNGTFKTQVAYATAFGEPYALVAADFNGDKKPDLAVSNAGVDSVGILLGNGDGTFSSHVDYWAGNGPGLMVAADFNGDSKIDLAVPDYGWANRADQKVTVLLGNGDGTLRSHAVYQTGDTPVAVAAGDFNNDGHPDLVLANSLDGTVSVLLGNGDGTYQGQTTYGVGNNPSAVGVGDFDGDGNLDVAVANEGTLVAPENTVSILLGKGDGTFQQPTNVTVGANPKALSVGDFNHDGKLDLIVNNCGDSSLGVLLGNGDGSFQPQVTAALPAAGTALALGDLNNDHQLDVVVALSQTNEVATLLGNGDGSFKSAVHFAAGNNPVSVTVGDFNHDGQLDVAVANLNDNTVGVLLGKGDGSLHGQVAYASGTAPSAVIAADINGDGQLELLASSQYSNVVNLLVSNGNGTFQLSPTVFGLGWVPAALIAVDVNGDGALDIVSADSGGRSASVLVNGRGSYLAFDASPQNSSYGETIILTATVKQSVKWEPAPTGTVNFFDGGTVVGSASLSGTIATLPLSTLSSGKHTLSAVYLGNTDFQSHMSSAVAQNVSTATTTVLLTSSPNPSGANQSVTLTAVVTPDTSGTPTGSVTFLDGTQTLGTNPLVGGAVTLSTASLGGGTHTLTAQYGGDQNFSGNVSPVLTQVINGPTFSITASPFSAAVIVGQTTTSTVTLRTASGFSSGVTLTCSAGLPAGASCSFSPALVIPNSGGATSTLALKTTNTTPAGSYTISVTGTSSTVSATDATLNLTVNDFKVSAPASMNPSSISDGQSATVSITATSLEGFAGSVNLTCSVSPTAALTPTCSLSPTSLTPTAGGSTSTLTIQTTASSAAVARPTLRRQAQFSYALWTPFLGMAFLGLGLTSQCSKRRKRLALVLFTLLFSGLFFQGGCGGGSTISTSGKSGTAPGSYTVAVTGTYGSGASALTHQATVTIQIK